MNASTATLCHDDAPPWALPGACPPAAPNGPARDRAGRRKAGTLRLVVAKGPASLGALPPPRALPREAVRVTAFRPVLDVAGAPRGTAHLLSHGASDLDLGLLVRRVLATLAPIGPEARPHDLIHPGRAFCDGAWTRLRPPARLARIAGCGPLPDRTRSVSLQRIGSGGEGAILLTPRPRHGFAAGSALLGLHAAASPVELGAAVRGALALRR